MKYDIIIIGGGASGLCTAINAKKENNRVLLIEHGDRLGKKLLSTGNGKCNLTNMYCTPSLLNKNPEGIYPYFSSGKREFIETVIAAFDAGKTVEFFKSLGILTENKNGYVYPRSEQAASVLEILEKTCGEIGVDILLGCQPFKVERFRGSGCRFIVDSEYICRSLVLATGGMAAPGTGSDGSGYEIARAFGHHIVKPRPALCAVRCSDKFFRDLSGVRCDGRVKLYDDEKREIISAYGNLQLNSYGISGIPVFQISSEFGRLLDAGVRPEIRLDFLPEFTEEKLAEYIETEKTWELTGLLNSRLAAVVRREAAAAAEKHGRFTYAQICAAVIKRFRVHPVGLNSFAESQTTAGGVSTDEINPETMESKLCKGLHFTGEITDVNGICGGYNLQWAFSTACAAAKAVSGDRA